MSEEARIEEQRSYAWRCLDDDPAFAMDKLDQIINELLQHIAELERRLEKREEQMAEIRGGEW